jgi:hypothetical protein
MCFGGGHSCKCGMGGGGAGGAAVQTEDFATAEVSSLDRPSLESRLEHIGSFDYRPYLPENCQAGESQRQLLIRELQRYFELATLGYNFELCAADVDRIWHEMILHTPAYAAFCKRAFGYYLHHVPGRFIAEEPQGFDEFTTVYEERFGEAPPSGIWSKEAVSP